VIEFLNGDYTEGGNTPNPQFSVKCSGFSLLEFPWNFEELAPELYGKKDNDADHKPDCRASE
jgi:hypothetical protein